MLATVMAAVRFCPFCRESFEGVDACPEHGLRLVDFQALPKLEDPRAPDAWMPWSTLAFGRGPLLFGALLMLAAFFLPFAAMHGGLEAESSLYDLARQRAQTLWMVPLSACAMLAVFYRRRTLRGLFSVRLVVAWLGVVPAVVAGVRLFGSYQAAARLSAKLGEPVAVTPGAGVFTLAAAMITVLFAATRLGRERQRAVRVEELV